MNAADLAREGIGPQKEVDEPGARHFRLRNQRAGRQCHDDGLRELARILTRRFREAHRDARGVIAVHGIARPLDGHERLIRHPGYERADELADGREQQLFQRGFQGIGRPWEEPEGRASLPNASGCVGFRQGGREP